MKQWTLHTHALLNDHGLRHGWTDTTGPNFHGDPTSTDHAPLVAELAEKAGLDGAAWAHQVHGGQVLYVSEPGLAGEADALWTDTPGLGVLGCSADCPLILVGGPRDDGSNIVGLAHASWRSTVKGITRELLTQMIVGGLDPARAHGFICPSAGPCCYDVGEEVRQAALNGLGPEAAWYFIEQVERLTFDLWAANVAQLMGMGIPEDSITQAGVCTICGEGYPSYRRDGEKAGRFAAVIDS